MTKQILNEMGEITRKEDGFPFTVWVYSEDHSPAHIHLYNKDDGKLITKILLTDNYPATVEELQIVKGFKIPSKTFMKEVFKWAYSKNKKGWQYWDVALFMWDSLHPNDKVQKE